MARGREFLEAGSLADAVRQDDRYDARDLAAVEYFIGCHLDDKNAARDFPALTSALRQRRVSYGSLARAISAMAVRGWK